jgi:hypothetical protein
MYSSVTLMFLFNFLSQNEEQELLAETQDRLLAGREVFNRGVRVAWAAGHQEAVAKE